MNEMFSFCAPGENWKPCNPDPLPPEVYGVKCHSGRVVVDWANHQLYPKVYFLKGIRETTIGSLEVSGLVLDLNVSVGYTVGFSI